MAIIEVINVVGFPIAVSVALFWLNRETIQANKQTESELRTAIQDNTNVMRELVIIIKEMK